MNKDGNPEQAATGKEFDNSHYLAEVKANVPADPKEAAEYFLKELNKVEDRRKNTLGTFTSNKQEIKAQQAQIDFLKTQVKGGSLELSPEMAEELDNLKISDINAWRVKVNELEANSTNQFAQTIDNGLTEVAQKATKDFELEGRKMILASFTQANPDFDITKPEIAEQIPPVYIKQLEQGMISYSDFLVQAKKFVTAPKTTAQEVPKASGSNTNHEGGGGKPGAKSKETQADVYNTYNKLIF